MPNELTSHGDRDARTDVDGIGGPVGSPPHGPPAVPLCSVFRRHLKSVDLKYTQERADVLAAVMGKEGLFEPETLFLEMTRAGHRVSRATIYRTLRLLQDCGIIVPALVDAKQTRYELAYGRRPRNLLVCVRSGRVVEFDSPEMASLRDEICRRHGFAPIGHRVLVYGVGPGAAVSEGRAHATNGAEAAPSRSVGGGVPPAPRKGRGRAAVQPRSSKSSSRKPRETR